MADKFSYIYEDPTNINQITGSTPFGIYDSDKSFISESLQITKYVARKLGHPVMQLEMNSGSIYATYEESVSEYSQQINHYNMKNWMWEHYGSSNRESGSTYNSMGSEEAISPHMGTTWMLSDQ
jgi:glutaredoxin 2